MRQRYNTLLLVFWIVIGGWSCRYTPSPNHLAVNKNSTALNSSQSLPGDHEKHTRYIYITDKENARVVRMDDMEGIGWKTYRMPSTPSTGVMDTIETMFVDEGGKIYIAEPGNSYVWRMDDIEGRNREIVYGLPHEVVAMFVDHQKRLYTLVYGQNYVLNRSDTSNAKTEISYSLSKENGFQKRSADYGFCVDSEGRIYFADAANQRIVRIDDMTGKNRIVLSRTGIKGQEFRGPMGLCLDRSGRIYVADYDQIIRIDDMSGKNWTSLHNYQKHSFYNLVSIWADDEGYIYATAGSPDRVIRVDDMTGNGWFVSVVLLKRIWLPIFCKIPSALSRSDWIYRKSGTLSWRLPGNRQYRRSLNFRLTLFPTKFPPEFLSRNHVGERRNVGLQ